MGLPVVPIISAVTPLVLGALDLYRRRSGAAAEDMAQADEPGPSAGSGSPLRRRLQALEESDLEQARLIAELSRNVEALARVVASQQEENQRREARIRRLLTIGAGLVIAALALAAWALRR